MPYVIRASGADRCTLLQEFEPEIDGRLQTVRGLRRPTAREIAAIPRTLRIGRPKLEKLLVILGWESGPFILCPRLRDILEELEPGRHKFVPIAIKTRREFQGRIAHGTYHLMLSPPRLDAVLVEETAFIGGFGRDG